MCAFRWVLLWLCSKISDGKQLWHNTSPRWSAEVTSKAALWCFPRVHDIQEWDMVYTTKTLGHVLWLVMHLISLVDLLWVSMIVKTMQYVPQNMSTCMLCFVLWMPQKFTIEKPALVQVMAWCHRATSHYLSQCSPKAMSQKASLWSSRP